MTHNVERSFTCPKCEKTFLRKDNMSQHVKKIHQTYANFIKTYPGYAYQLFYSYISLDFDLGFVKYFILMTIYRPAFFADGTFMSTISFMLCLFFKLIEQSGRLLVLTYSAFADYPF